MAIFSPRRLIGLLGLVLLWHILFSWWNSASALFQSPPRTLLSCFGHQNASASIHIPGALSNMSYAVLDLESATITRQDILQADSLPLSCLSDFMARGTACPDSRRLVFDVVWTYVNGSDPLHEASYARRFKEYYSAGPHANLRAMPIPKLFRDHDELRHSMRSVLHNFREHVSQFHLLTADFPLPAVTNTTDACVSSSSRLAQIPQWLDETMQRNVDSSVSLHVQHHARFFTQYTDTIFNSFAIESQLSNVANLGEHFLYLNDDYFLTGSLSPADFYTRQYGHVLRLQSDAVVLPASKSTSSARGEWFALEHSNELLSRRFGFRNRPYLVHQAKTGSRAVMEEMRLAFSAEMLAASRNAFRDEPSSAIPVGERDVHAMWMFANFVVERWREALLWTWVVAKLGGHDDAWGPNAIYEANKLGWLDHKSAEMNVNSGPRLTLSRNEMMLHLGVDSMPRRTTYEFSAQDGYPFQALGRKGRSSWPNFTLADANNTTLHTGLDCRIAYDRCFPARLTRASDVFTHIAFENIECGDCVITALVSMSGELGLSAFLPASDRVAAVESKPGAPDLPPHLPLHSDWRRGDYSLRSVLRTSSGSRADVNMRDWAVRLLHRYQWVIGSTPSHFQSLSSPKQARSALAKVKADIRGDKYALLCLNDNIAMRADETSQVFRDWQEEMWGERMVWEKDDL